MIKSIVRLMFAFGGVAVMGTGVLAQESIFNPPITSDPSILNQNQDSEPSPQPQTNVSKERSPSDPTNNTNNNSLSGVEIRISEQTEVRVRNNALNIDSPGIVEFVNRF